MQFTVTCGDHDQNRVCSTREFAKQVSLNTWDFWKYSTGVTKYPRVMHSRVWSLNRAVPYLPIQVLLPAQSNCYYCIFLTYMYIYTYTHIICNGCSSCDTQRIHKALNTVHVSIILSTITHFTFTDVTISFEANTITYVLCNILVKVWPQH